MQLTEVAPGVFACLQPDRGLGWSNSGLVRAGGGMVIDTHWDLPTTARAMDLFATVLPEPARRLVNTHHNGDHCYGNQLYAEVGTELIGHRLCAEYLGRDAGPGFLQGLGTAAPESLPEFLRPFAEALSAYDFTGVEVTPPTTLVEDSLELDLDGTEVRIVYLGPAHTPGDVIVHLPAHGVVFTGDLLFHQCTPIGWEGTSERWLAALDHIVALGAEVVVPGHGPLATNEGVLAMRDYLAYVFAEARQHYDAGRSALDAARRIELGPYAGWTEPERLAFNVHRAYREFAGEPWDAPVDTMAVFADMDALRRHFSGHAA